jgi:8-oxo-dGTP pyrophosphatase MutT (NUDIX family)
MVRRIINNIGQNIPWRVMRASKFVAAGAIIFDPEGRVLMVRHRIRGEWEYPVGASEGRESPIDCCRREVTEEVGITPTRYRLLGVDYSGRTTPNGNLVFTFGAEATAAQVQSLKLDRLELTAHRWVSREEAVAIIAPRLRDRFIELLGAYDNARPVYLHTGRGVGELTG